MSSRVPNLSDEEKSKKKKTPNQENQINSETATRTSNTPKPHKWVAVDRTHAGNIHEGQRCQEGMPTIDIYKLFTQNNVPHVLGGI